MIRATPVAAGFRWTSHSRCRCRCRGPLNARNKKDGSPPQTEATIEYQFVQWLNGGMRTKVLMKALVVSDGRLICVCVRRRGSGFLWSWRERVRPSVEGRHRDGARALASIARIVLQRGVDVPLSPVQILKQRDQFRDRAWYIVVDHEQFKLVAHAFHKGSTHGLIIIRCMGGQALEVRQVRVEVVAFLAKVAHLLLGCAYVRIPKFAVQEL